MRIGGAAAVGVIVASVILYWIRPVNAGAISLVTFVCCGLAVGFASLMSPKKMDRSRQ